MDWSNEQYVRLYSRDTATWLKMRWQGQAVFTLLLRKVDRSGVIDNVTDPVDDVSLITGLPEEVVEEGLKRLRKHKVVKIENDTLLIPNFMEAQECSKSDRLRQKESREKRRRDAESVTKCDKVVTKCDTGKTKRDKKSQVVTSGHDSSQGVTLCFADPVLCSADPDPVLCNADPIFNATGGGITKSKAKKPAKTAKGTPTWEAYSEAYEQRYGTKPVRNAKTNKHCCQLVDNIGAEEAPLVAAFFVGLDNQWYVTKGHSLQALVGDCEKVRTEWATGCVQTATQAREADRMQGEGQRIKSLLDRVRKEDRLKNGKR